MQCPQCGSSSLRIEVRFAGFVSCCFSDDEQFEVTDTVSMSSEWDDASCCDCAACTWLGTVDDARRSRTSAARVGACVGAAGGRAEAVGTLSGIDQLQDVKAMLKVRKCAPDWRECIDFLLDEVERLEKMLELVQRANAKSKNGNSSSETNLM